MYTSLSINKSTNQQINKPIIVTFVFCGMSTHRSSLSLLPFSSPLLALHFGIVGTLLGSHGRCLKTVKLHLFQCNSLYSIYIEYASLVDVDVCWLLRMTQRPRLPQNYPKTTETTPPATPHLVSMHIDILYRSQHQAPCSLCAVLCLVWFETHIICSSIDAQYKNSSGVWGFVPNYASTSKSTHGLFIATLFILGI